MNHEPSFFLDPTENDDVKELRACWEMARLKDSYRDDYMLVKIDPPLIGQPYGLGGKDIDQLLLATRHVGHTLFPVTEWPEFVYIVRILDESIISKREFSEKQVELILGGVLYRTWEEAIAALTATEP